MKNKMIYDKRAAMTAKMLVSIIVIALGFVILLFVYSQFLFTQEIDKQICHESILARHTFNVGILELGKTSVPLKCQTEKICLFRDKEDCYYAFGDANEENIITEIEINKDDSKAKLDVMDTIANSMYDCHSMLGEGKLNFMPHEWSGKTYCLICSRIALDNVSKNIIENITLVEFFKYLELKKDSEGVSYLRYLYGADEASDMNTRLSEAMQYTNEKLNTGTKSINEYKINLNQENSIQVKVVTEGTWKSWTKGIVAGTLWAVAIGGTVFSGGGSLALIAVAGAVTFGGTTTVVVGNSYPHDDYNYIGPLIIPYKVSNLVAGGCTSFETAP